MVFLAVIPVVIIAWASLLLYCIKVGDMQPYDISMTVVFALYFLLYLYVPIELY